MYRLALVGFGNVGQGLVQLLITKATELEAKYQFNAKVVAVATLRKGSLYHPDGLDLAALLAAGRAGDFHTYPDSDGLIRGLDPLATITQTNADVVVETTYSEFTTAEPATTYFRAAFTSGKHLVTANKGPVALHFHELAALAKQHQRFFGFEGTVMGGTPSLRLARRALAGCTISGLRGIVNGTTNYILAQMENETDYAVALAEAQRLGYAEADPSGDVEGHDALGKLVILVNTIMGQAVKFEQVPRQGITHITREDIAKARQAGARYKLIASATLEAGKVVASVAPQLVPMSDPLAGVNGITNAISYETDILGGVTLVGAGAGPVPTGFALLSDLLELHGYGNAT